MRGLNIALVALAAALTTSACAQDIDRFLRVRRQYHIANPTSIDVIKDAANGQVAEIAGTVKGTCKVNDTIVLLLDRPGHEALEVETEFDAEWLTTPNIDVRMVVKTVRPDPYIPARIVLLAVAKDSEVTDREAAAAAKDAAARSKRTASKPRSSRMAIRTDGGLYGSISRSGSRMERRAGNVSADQAIPIYADFIRSRNPRLGDDVATQMARNIILRSQQFSIDARLVVAIVMVESDFDPSSVSNHGAVGLGQLMPGTAQWMGVSDSYDIEQNIYGMVKLLRTLRDMFARESSTDAEMWQKTIAAYNAGDGAVRRAHGIPPIAQTQRYVRRVLELWNQLASSP